MFFKKIYDKVNALYVSFYRPGRVDVGVARREKLAILYALSAGSLFLYTSYILFQMLKNPEFAQKAKVHNPNAHVIKLGVDLKNFSIKRLPDTDDEMDKEIKSDSSK